MAWPPDIVITEVIMPEMNGIKLSERIASLFPACGVIFFSAVSATANLLEDVQRLGPSVEILSKPIPPGDILARIKGFLMPLRHEGQGS